MKVLMINSVCGIGSTGRICAQTAQRLEREGHEVKIAYGRDSRVPESCRRFAVRIGSDWDVRLHGVQSRLFDMHGFGSKRATKQFIQWAEAFNPDLVWLHNIHGYYINVELLFAWIKSRSDMQVKWTLHDCWAFTGHCVHFEYVGCTQWKNRCEHCVQKREYPASLLLDRCRANYERKRKAFTGVSNLKLITPCKWLSALVGKSFLKEYPTEVVYNTIDTDVFRPTESRFREDYGLEEKRVILGVAGVWYERKGLGEFMKLAAMLDERYAIVLVGLTQEQIDQLPAGAVGIRRTESAKELAAIYTAADVFVNPTFEDNYPTVNLEAQACGTRVITYATGGAPETIWRADSCVVPAGDLEALKKRIEEGWQ